MERFWNLVKARAGGMDGLAGVARFGLVSSFDPGNYAARVLIQPENILSGWLPVLSAWVGNGWGFAAPLSPGDQVLVLSQEAQSEHGVVIGSVFSTADKPLAAPSGELWLQHKTGSFLKLHNDGSIAMQAGDVTITGNLIVSGDISDVNSAHGTLANLRNAHNTHTHILPQGGNTETPSVIV